MDKPQEKLQYTEILKRIVNDKYPGKTKVVDATFQVTEGCSLCCKYCYEFEKTSHRMTFETAKKFTDNLFSQYSQEYFAAICSFIGGEPLLEPELIREIVDYWKYMCIMNMDTLPWYKYIVFDICSNGTEYFKPEVQKLLKYIGDTLSFTITIDGNKELHDSARLYPDGRGSYDDAISAATHYETNFNRKLGSKITIAPSNLDYLEDAIKYYLDSGATDINANCVYEDVWTLKDATKLYYSLKKIADYKIDNYPTVFLSLFKEELFKPIAETENGTYCGGRGEMISCAPDGIIYPCIRYTPISVGHNKDNYITMGDVNNGINFSFLKEIQNIGRKDIEDDECFNCPIHSGCGECAAYSWQVTGSLTKKVKFICPMHKARALANVYYWNKFYKKYGFKETFKNYVPKEWALEIIDEEEFNMLNDLCKEEV